jgi:ABC-2 type transport system ATP-binding protein
VDDVRELCTEMAIMNLGRIIYNGGPEDAIATLEGQVWEKRIEREELSDYKNQYQVISEKMIAGKPLIHIQSEVLPAEGFKAVAPNLEDVFFSSIMSSSESVTL